jgi:hypothetical protein
LLAHDIHKSIASEYYLLVLILKVVLPWLGSAQLHIGLTFNVPHHWVRIHADPQFDGVSDGTRGTHGHRYGPHHTPCNLAKAARLSIDMRRAFCEVITGTWAGCCRYPEQESRVLSTRPHSFLLASPIAHLCMLPALLALSFVCTTLACMHLLALFGHRSC